MVNVISCPRCSLPVDPQARFCDHCGVDLALAAVMVEPSVINPAQIPTGVQLAPEILVPRMGETMIEKGLLSEEQLQEALDYQKARSQTGGAILIGQALLELGFTSRETLDEVITAQILQLQQALGDSNRRLEHRVRTRTKDLQDALDRLAELNRLKSNFIANISHELRTPLTHLKGYLDLLAAEVLGPLSPQQTNALKILLRSESKLERLIEDLILFSLASRGEMTLSLDMVPIFELVRAAVVGSKQKASAKGISLEINVPEGLPELKIDHEKISWVLTQLLDNAIKFTPEGGSVWVKSWHESGIVHLTVEDTGIGIPPDRVGEVFESFHQLDGSATRRFGGTGMGLTLVSRIIDAHHARIQVESQVNKGSVFEITFSNTVHQSDPSSGV
jgi:signal transduction histidine kinase